MRRFAHVACLPYPRAGGEYTEPGAAFQPPWENRPRPRGGGVGQVTTRGRILYWTERFWPAIGGVEVLSAHLLPDLVARGYDIEVVTSDVEFDEPEHRSFFGVDLHRLPMRQVIEQRDMAGLRSCWEQVARIKERFRPDLVHLNTNGPSMFFHQKTARVAGSRSLFTCHGLWAAVPEAARGRAPRNSLLAQIVQGADDVTAVSQAVHRDLLDLGADPRRTAVLYNGLQAPVEPPSAPSFDPPVFLCVARFIRDKGVDTALAAFADVARDHPRARLRLAGGGPERAALEQQAVARGVAERVDFLGWVPPEDVHAAMGAASAVLVPSRWEEPFGLVAAEAGQVARPAIVTRVGGLPEIVVDGETGFVVEKDDPAALAEAMRRVLTDPARAAALGRAAQARVAEHFGWARFVDEIDEHYLRLVALPA